MRDPEAAFSLPSDLDLEVRYRARLEEIEERESTVPGARPGSSYLAYKFSLHSLDNIPVLDDNGDVYLQWATCNTNTGYSRAPYIGSREIAEALAGSKLSDDDVRQHLDDWEDWLVGKTGMVDLMKITDDKTGNERVRIVRILPDRGVRQAAPAARPAAPQTPSAPAQVAPSNGAAETREERLARLKAEMEALEAVE